jgi:protein TonB
VNARAFCPEFWLGKRGEETPALQEIKMFEDSMIESQKRFKSGRLGAATVLSFALQALVIGLVLLIPLMVTQALPTPKVVTQLIAPPPPPPPPPPPAASKAATPVEHTEAVKPLQPNEIRTPSRIPRKIEMAQADTQVGPPPSVAGVVGGVKGGVAGGQIGGVLGGVLNSAGTATPKLAAPKKVRVSQGVAQGLLVHKVMPEYPPIAREAHIQGIVVLQAEISKSGTINDVQVVSGPPQLAPAALEAVRQWRYKPYYLNGQPVEIQTTINVNFTLEGAAS